MLYTPECCLVGSKEAQAAVGEVEMANAVGSVGLLDIGLH